MYNQDKKKEQLLKYLHELSSVTRACRKAKLSRTIFYEWLKKDKQFAKEIESIKEEELDFAEDCLKSAMNKGDTKAILYYLNTRGKSRGWGAEEQKIDITSGGKPIKYADIMPHSKGENE